MLVFICDYGAKFEFNWAKLKQTKEIILKKSYYVINGLHNVISGNIYDISEKIYHIYNKFYCMGIYEKLNNKIIRTFDYLIETSKITIIHQSF